MVLLLPLVLELLLLPPPLGTAGLAAAAVLLPQSGAGVGPLETPIVKEA